MSTPEVSQAIVTRELRGQLAEQTQAVAALEVEVHELRRLQESQRDGLVSMRDRLDAIRAELGALLPDEVRS